MRKSEKTSEQASSSGMLKIVLTVLIIIVATIIATLYFAVPQALPSWMPFTPSAAASEPQAAPAPPPPAAIPTPIFLELQPFTAILHDAQGRRRVLYVEITLRVDSQADRTRLTEYMPEVRDRILRKLSIQDPVEVQTADGRTLLAQALTRTLALPYHPQLPAPHLHKVLFTAFVVQ